MSPRWENTHKFVHRSKREASLSSLASVVWCVVSLTVALAFVLAGAPTFAQAPPAADAGAPTAPADSTPDSTPGAAASGGTGSLLDGIGNLGNKPGFDLGGLGGPPQAAQVFLRAEWKRDAAQPNRGYLFVHAEIEDKHHIYSLTQMAGGPRKSEIALPEKKGDWALAGPFVPLQMPHLSSEEFWPGVVIEEHDVEVTWVAPIQIPASAGPDDLGGTIQLTGQICNTGCADFEVTAAIAFAGDHKSTGVYKSPVAKVRWDGVVKPSIVKPGDTVRVHLRATPDEDWHIYAQSTEKQSGGRPTMISLIQGFGHPDWPAMLTASADPKPNEKPDESPYYEDEVTWVLEMAVPSDAKPGVYDLAGLIGFQTCDVGNCLPPSGARFDVHVQVTDAEAPSDAKAFLEFTKSTYGEAEALASSFVWQSAESMAGTTLRPKKDIKISSFLAYLGFGLLGGFILNGMPCVLPVLSLKVLSLVDQAGKDRWSVWSNNLVYSAGILFVFLIFATLTSFFSLMWGQQMQSTGFLIGLCLLVFTLALSLLGVWELPIPGFAMSGSSQKLQEHDGLIGTFFKGTFTTLLAIPCSGPFLGTAFGKVFGAPTWMIFVFYISIGLGMASPYFIISANTKLIRWLPKPGAWMEVFKEMMGFVLIFTTVYQLSLIKSELWLPMLLLLAGVGFGCWCIGKIPYGAKLSQRVAYWAPAAAVVALSAWVGFNYLVTKKIGGDAQQVAHTKYIDWTPYSFANLKQASQSGKTVMVEFTANWCPNCKVNMKVAIETPEVKAKLDELNAVPMLADWTDSNPEIKQALIDLERASIPIVAIFPQGEAKDVIVLDDLITKGQLLKALDEAGPSRKTLAAADPPPPTAVNE